jgi:hypothetical protein
MFQPSNFIENKPKIDLEISNHPQNVFQACFSQKYKPKTWSEVGV